MKKIIACICSGAQLLISAKVVKAEIFQDIIDER